MSIFRHEYHVDHPGETRFEFALDLLESGKNVVLGDASLSLTERELSVRVASSWTVGEVTEDRARTDLARAEAALDLAKSSSERFKSLVARRTVVLHLIDDYHTGWQPICELRGSELEWQRGYPKMPAN